MTTCSDNNNNNNIKRNREEWKMKARNTRTKQKLCNGWKLTKILWVLLSTKYYEMRLEAYGKIDRDEIWSIAFRSERVTNTV